MHTGRVSLVETEKTPDFQNPGVQRTENENLLLTSALQ